MTTGFQIIPADLIERLMDLLGEADAVTDEEVRKVSRGFTTAPSGQLRGGISRGGQRIKALSVRKALQAEAITLAHSRSFLDVTTEGLVQRLRDESSLLEMFLSFELIERFGNDDSIAYEISRGFEIWVRPDNPEPFEDEEEGLDDLPFPPLGHGK